jgi:hypothetical protein
MSGTIQKVDRGDAAAIGFVPAQPRPVEVDPDPVFLFVKDVSEINP